MKMEASFARASGKYPAYSGILLAASCERLAYKLQATCFFHGSSEIIAKVRIKSPTCTQNQNTLNFKRVSDYQAHSATQPYL